ncbi:amidohydrolase family protein [Nitrosovibrio sp. Nv17]|uniref:amidohydrolase family protein n=1 Tax=Nitrosovibrio sp. Nv17 TaxID=1855339 RepID=UPI000908CB32|nr:amidohydrolase family protein [Nitrosovibrio sp. Nv17]SFW36657.1 hypothetical protein SAMN05216414_12444 [Nitrosovibrio sp. Nv17]
MLLNAHETAKDGKGIERRLPRRGSFYHAARRRAAERTPPYRRMLEMGVKVGAGTDATRVASHDPWNALYWLVTGNTLGGLTLYPASNRIDRETALRLYTEANTWFSNEEGVKGQISLGRYADLAVLSADYFQVPEDEIRNLVSVLTIVGGRIVHGYGEFGALAPPLPPAMPDWSPVNYFGGYFKPVTAAVAAATQRQARAACGCGNGCAVHGHAHGQAYQDAVEIDGQHGFWGALGCSCWAV